MSPAAHGFTWLIAAGLPTISLVRELLTGRRIQARDCAVHSHDDSLLTWCAFWWAYSTISSALQGQWEMAVEYGYGTCVYVWLWWRGRGEDDAKRLLDRVSGLVRAAGARLVVVPQPA